MIKKIYKLKKINIDSQLEFFEKEIISKKENIDILNKISNGPNGYNISNIFKKENIPFEYKNILDKNKPPMLISFFNVGWHDDKDFATKSYPWFLIIVLEDYEKNDFQLDIGKRKKRETTILKKGEVYLINTQYFHRVLYKGMYDDKPCSIIVSNTNIREKEILDYI